MKTKSTLGFSAVAAIVMIVGSATILSIAPTTLNVEAQNAATTQQIKDYLGQAILALDNGDNVKAIQQLRLAAEQMGAPTGVSVAATSDGESGDEGEGVEDGPGEDADEPGDSDKNDEED